jgi:hypothetical protein
LSRSQWSVRSGPIVELIVALLVIWAILAVLSLVSKGLIWLFVVGLILVVTGISDGCVVGRNSSRNSAHGLGSMTGLPRPGR